MKPLLALFLVWAVIPAFAGRKKEPNEKLCQVKTVFVIGNSKSAVGIRKELAKRTWLKLANSQDDADAILDIAEENNHTSPRGFMDRDATIVSGNLTQKSVLLWSESTASARGPQGPFTPSYRVLLDYLKEDGGCK